MTRLHRALESFDALAFAKRHGGHKESRSRKSHEYLLTCPSCGSDRLRWSHPKKSCWICWGCRLSGDTVSLIQLLEKCDESAAIAIVLDGYVGGDATHDLVGVQVQSTAPKQLAPIPWPQGVDLLDWHSQAHARAKSYLESRGVSWDLIRDRQLGFARTGRLKNRLVYTCRHSGRLLYWQARATWGAPAQIPAALRREWEKQTGFRKVLNPTSTECSATAQDVVFGWDSALGHEHVVVTEGPMDAIKIGPHAVALLGKSASPQKLHRVKELGAKSVTVYLDSGAEEWAATVRIARELSGSVETRVAVPPAGFDPGSLTPEQNRNILANAQIFKNNRLIRPIKT